MARYVDTVELPEKFRAMRVLVLSPSRYGTLGLWKALKVLGYNSYHNLEVFRNGIRDMSMLREALRARHDPNIKPYGRESDRLWGNYDAILEVSGYLAPEAVAAYLPDPNVKFILLHRDPDAFYFDAYNNLLFGYTQDLYATMAEGRRTPKSPGSADAVRRTYIEQHVLLTGGSALYSFKLWLTRDSVRMVKESVPAERLKEIKLEEGLDWEQICPYLGHDIPDVEYEKPNSANEVRDLMSQAVRPGILEAEAILGAGAAAIIGIGIWFLFK